MSRNRVVIVGDAHLYHSEGSRTDKLFHNFLKEVPALGNHLVINGDLFEFWFEYRTVIPRRLFPTLALLAALREKGVVLTITGGNHDRWGGRFWREQLGVRFEPEGCDMQLAEWNSRVVHGDGLGERHVGARILHWLTRKKMTVGMFRLVHPDVGLWGVSKLSRLLSSGTRTEQMNAKVADTQESFARQYLSERPNLQMLVMGHTHKASLVEVRSGQWYLNPGPWMEEARYATVDDEGPELHVFGG